MANPTPIYPQKSVPVPPSVRTNVKTLDLMRLRPGVNRCSLHSRQENLPAHNYGACKANHGSKLEVPSQDLFLAEHGHILLIRHRSSILLRHCVDRSIFRNDVDRFFEKSIFGLVFPSSSHAECVHHPSSETLRGVPQQQYMRAMPKRWPTKCTP